MKELKVNNLKTITSRKLFVDKISFNKKLSYKTLIKAPNLSMISNIKNLKQKSSQQKVISERLKDISSLSKDVSEKYKIKEKDLYDKLYLKVRKLFLEAL